MTEQKILLVQDENWPFQVLKTALAKQGYEVTSCMNAFDAIDEMRSDPNHLVVASVKLPDMSGFQLSCLLKSAQIMRDIPVVVVGTREELSDGFWKRASLCDLLLERAEVEFDEEKAISKLKPLLSSTGDAVKSLRTVADDDGEYLLLPTDVNGRDLIGSYRQMMSFLLTERSVTTFCRDLVESINSRVEFMTRFFGYMRRVFGSELTGLVVADERSSWGTYEFDGKVPRSAFEKLQTEVNKTLRSSEAPRLAINGEIIEKGGNTIKTSVVLPVHSSKQELLGVLVLGWYHKQALDKQGKVLAELLKNEMQPVFRALLSLQEIQSLKQAQAFNSSTDPATGLYNLDFFIGFLQQQLLFSSRQKQPVGVILIGIDHFTELNEEFGPQVGDSILSTLARRLSEVVRSSDLLARYSGDQFALVLPNTDITGSQTLAEKLRRDVETMKWEPVGGNEPKVTISVGCAAFKQDDVNPETILHDAKQALQNAKQAGRNRVAV